MRKITLLTAMTIITLSSCTKEDNSLNIKGTWNMVSNTEDILFWIGDDVLGVFTNGIQTESFKLQQNCSQVTLMSNMTGNVTEYTAKIIGDTLKLSEFGYDSVLMFID